MSYTASDLILARRHVDEAGVRIARQREIIAELQRAGHPTETALDLLHALETTAEQMRVHLGQIEDQLELRS